MFKKIKKWWILSLFHTVLPVMISFFLFVLSYVYILVPALENNMMTSRQTMTRELTTSVCFLLEEYEDRYQSGEFTREEAMNRAAKRIRAMRYGPEEKDYFWISDTLPQMIMHPYRSDLEGRDLGGYQDTGGNFLFRDMVEAVWDSGSGYVDYFWQWKDAPEKIMPKTSYVQYFAPWGWIVGTGVYVDDLEEKIDLVTTPLRKTYVVILLILVFLAAYMITQSGQLENQRMKTLMKLRESEERFRTIFNSQFNMVVLLNEKTKILEMNQAGLDLLDKRNADIQGQSLFSASFWPDTGDHCQILEQAVEECREKGMVRFSARNKAADGRIIDVDAALSAIRNSANEIQLMILEMRDITEQKQAEIEMKSLIQALEEQKGELERFTYTVSHDLKSPLITIKGFLGLLKVDSEEHNVELLHRDIGRITDAVNKMEALLKDLLELSRIGRIINEPEILSMEALVNEARELTQGQMSAQKIHFEIKGALPSVYGDGMRLREVLVNLFSNAAKFMGNQLEPRIEVGFRKQGNESCFYVKDNGIGIEKKHHERIFGLFDKLNSTAEGTGIGLAIVKRIIEVHGGHIYVESEGLGQGSVFCFTLKNTEKNDADVYVHNC